MNALRIPKYSYPNESRICVAYALFILAVIGIAAFICRAGTGEAIRVAQVVKNLECTRP